MTGFWGLDGPAVYMAITVAAIIEGEVAYVAASMLVAQGHLNPFGVVLAGALGAAVGDQAYFYVFRGRLPRWIAKFPALERKSAPLIERVRRHDALMVLLIRFAPGLRIALAAACACVGVSPLKFTLLNGLAALIWAVALLGVIGWAGPAYLSQFGLAGWQAALLMGLFVVGLFRVLGMYERRAMSKA